MPSDSATCVQSALVFGFIGLRPFSNFASKMELEMELDQFPACRKRDNQTFWRFSL
jgi:hypothetical protein